MSAGKDHDEKAGLVHLPDEGLERRASDAELGEIILLQPAGHGLRGAEGVRGEAGELGRVGGEPLDLLALLKDGEVELGRAALVAGSLQPDGGGGQLRLLLLEAIDFLGGREAVELTLRQAALQPVQGLGRRARVVHGLGGFYQRGEVRRGADVDVECRAAHATLRA